MRKAIKRIEKPMRILIILVFIGLTVLPLFWEQLNDVRFHAASILLVFAISLWFLALRRKGTTALGGDRTLLFTFVVAIFAAAVMLIVQATGNLSSPFFFMIYFLLVGGAVLLDAVTSIALTLLIVVYFLIAKCCLQVDAQFWVENSLRAGAQMISIAVMGPIVVFLSRTYDSLRKRDAYISKIRRHIREFEAEEDVLLGRIKDWILILEPSGSVLNCSEGLLDELNLTLSDVEGVPVWEVLKIQREDGKEYSLPRLISSGKNLGSNVVKSGLKIQVNGRQVSVSLTLQLVKEGNAVIAMFLVVQKTEGQTLQDQVLRDVDILTDYYMGKHLSMIKMLVSRIKTKYLAKEEKQEIIKLLSGLDLESSELVRVMDHVSLMVKIESASVKPQVDQVEIGSLASGVELSLARRDRNNGYSVLFDVLPPNLAIYTDGSLLKRIMILSIEFLSHVRAEGVHEISVIANKASGDNLQLKFSVEDTIIEASDLDNIKKRFFAGDIGVMNRLDGSGLELYLTRKLAGLLGGMLKIELMEGGATVTVIIRDNA